MRVRFSMWILSLALLAGVGCNKPSQSDNSAQNPDNPQANNSAPAPENSMPAKPVPTTVTVPAGKVITIRLADAVGSKISQPGQTFGGTLARAVEVGGEVVIPAGARVQGEVVDAKALGHFAGGALLQLKLNSIRVNGEQMPVETATLSQTIKGKGKRTGVLVGGGAGLGAVIGGLTGGGKGAAIGALAGGGAGTAGSAYTGNKEIVLPAESAVAFTLKQPLRVRK
ncbi:MAG: hypothetical protein AUG89_07525 [Acidobacteria bacterium 13_1_20CM_4_56_7]|nr:MAG: hypothetical protein AUG89_07525 [Acidobacteria bacterium 13_1_20CM_4_56_7]